MDVDGDTDTDLILVSAPMFVDKDREGRVYIYTLSGLTALMTWPSERLWRITVKGASTSFMAMADKESVKHTHKFILLFPMGLNPTVNLMKRFLSLQAQQVWWWRSLRIQQGGQGLRIQQRQKHSCMGSAHQPSIKGDYELVPADCHRDNDEEPALTDFVTEIQKTKRVDCTVAKCGVFKCSHFMQGTESRVYNISANLSSGWIQQVIPPLGNFMYSNRSVGSLQ
ncbi:unnamed protein product [Tetraodon nigroviridis]|uniref:(spotted green pufferfish) hypothetical protein n=1 Tax=Tetraodon nigroviridis TaxID=99883 RepID=Q4RVJ3_TETNG|nr:unnamed protein product [Tetraodon nigroviridis]